MGSHMFSNASIRTISGGTFINNARREKLSLEKLSAAAAHSALHDATARTDGTRCLLDTRTSVLDRVERWAQGLLDEEASIFWLHGGAGAGKSAVMQTLAERFAAQGLALGSFFFSRTDNTRNTAEVLIPTLVYQLVQRFASATEVLDPIIDRDPLIFKKNVEVQLLNLLVEPLQHLVQLGSISNTSQSPRVFLIDGLDECGNPTQQQAIIQAAAAVCHQHRIPVKFLIASRPEQAISTSFGLYTAENHMLGAISLSEDDDAPSDIRKFLEVEFSKICLQHPYKKMIPPGWPDGGDIDSLVLKSSSHFIYAATVMKYFWSAKDNPVRSLQVLLGLEVSRTISPFAELDSLYRHILVSAAHLDSVLQLLAYCIYAALRPSPPIICFMMDCSEDDLDIYLAEISPLATLGRSKPCFTRDYDYIVKLLHASLPDFLRDASRSGTLYINEEAYLASKFDKCFRFMAIPEFQKVHMTFYPKNYPEGLVQRSMNRELGLVQQIMTTIKRAGSLGVTQQALGRDSFVKYLDWVLANGLSLERLLKFVEFFLAVHSIKTSEGVTALKSTAQDFLSVLDTHVSLEKNPLVAAIFRLIFSGYPGKEKDLTSLLSFSLSRLLYLPPAKGSEFPDCDPYKWCQEVARHWDVELGISAAHITSIQHDLDTSSECLLVSATEGILWYLFDDGVEQIRANVVAQFSVDLLQWLLPKVAFSEKIELYSKRAGFFWDKYRELHDDISRVVDCLHEYNTWVLDWRIGNGDVNALIEKSRMYLLNDQD